MAFLLKELRPESSPPSVAPPLQAVALNEQHLGNCAQLLCTGPLPNPFGPAAAPISWRAAVPKTLSSAVAGGPASALSGGTGLWLVRLAHAWATPCCLSAAAGAVVTLGSWVLLWYLGGRSVCMWVCVCLRVFVSGVFGSRVLETLWGVNGYM